jgi:hypothetical protein
MAHLLATMQIKHVSNRPGLSSLVDLKETIVNGLLDMVYFNMNLFIGEWGSPNLFGMSKKKV